MRYSGPEFGIPTSAMNEMCLLTKICRRIFVDPGQRFLKETNNKGRPYTQLDSRKQVIAFQDRATDTKEALHSLKREK